MTAIQIDGAGRFAVTDIGVRVEIRVQPDSVAGVNVVLVLVVTEVLHPDLGLVPAVRRHRRPAELKRQEGKQDDGEKTVHGCESSGYRVYLGTTEVIEAGVSPFRRGSALAGLDIRPWCPKAQRHGFGTQRPAARAVACA